MQLRSQVGKERIIVPGAVMFIRNAAGHVLCLRRADDGRWQLPAGFIDLGESIAETAVREVREETGLAIELVRVLGVYAGEEDQVTYTNGDPVQNCSTFFEGRVTGGKLCLDLGENSAMDYFPPLALPASVAPRWRRRVARALEDTPYADFN
jgi:8-oxo-dGTP pyrophosphatase MutT (NUDIX family)